MSKEIQIVLSSVKEIKETKDVNEVHEHLSGGKWIAIHTAKTRENDILFSLGRVSD